MTRIGVVFVDHDRRRIGSERAVGRSQAHLVRSCWNRRRRRRDGNPLRRGGIAARISGVFTRTGTRPAPASVPASASALASTNRPVLEGRHEARPNRQHMDRTCSRRVRANALDVSCISVFQARRKLDRLCKAVALPGRSRREVQANGARAPEFGLYILEAFIFDYLRKVDGCSLLPTSSRRECDRMRSSHPANRPC